MLPEEQINVLPEETQSDYILRLCTSVKDAQKLTWTDIARIANNQLGLSYSESWYRKNFTKGLFLQTNETCCSAHKEDQPNCEHRTLDELHDCVDDKLHQLMLKKVQISDLVTQNNAYIRRLSREQTIKEIAHDYATIMSSKKLLDVNKNVRAVVSEKQGVLLLSDWHYGMVCDNPWNIFDPDVCKDRVAELLAKTIKIIKEHKINTVHVLDLADLIAGRIHTQIRIESRFDVITQTMQVAEILAEFLIELHNQTDASIKFYSCLDNHSRLEPNKKESMDLESLARLIPWYLQVRLPQDADVQICENKYGADIITCNVAGHNVIGVHGDNDRPATALERLSLMTHEHYAMLCTAHLHHMALEEDHQSMVVSNGCLMGVDRYAEKLRLTSDPTQTFIVATPENVCECIYRIVLK